jgi:hypothetical protein
VVTDKEQKGITDDDTTSWASNLHGRLAIIIMSTISRLLYKGTKEAFQFNEIAIDLANEIIVLPNF